ncbi:MAG: hypothetical protein MUP58_03080 [Candidatus Nanohaloarchaeota archaeon QJJ-9]|nr:hypothetical protein [Candidatus Nanohaloarchaeota archaeon QJJ-9]
MSLNLQTRDVRKADLEELKDVSLTEFKEEYFNGDATDEDFEAIVSKANDFVSELGLEVEEPSKKTFVPESEGERGKYDPRKDELKVFGSLADWVEERLKSMGMESYLDKFRDSSLLAVVGHETLHKYDISSSIDLPVSKVSSLCDEFLEAIDTDAMYPGGMIRDEAEERFGYDNNLFNLSLGLSMHNNRENIIRTGRKTTEAYEDVKDARKSLVNHLSDVKGGNITDREFYSYTEDYSMGEIDEVEFEAKVLDYIGEDYEEYSQIDELYSRIKEFEEAVERKDEELEDMVEVVDDQVGKYGAEDLMAVSEARAQFLSGYMEGKIEDDGLEEKFGNVREEYANDFRYQKETGGKIEEIGLGLVDYYRNEAEGTGKEKLSETLNISNDWLTGPEESETYNQIVKARG